MMSWRLVLVGVLAGCTGDPLPQPTVNPPGPPPIAPPVLPDQRFSRPAPVDMDLTDAGDAALDAGPDAGPTADAAAADAAPMQDAAIDAGLPDCNLDPCVLAVNLQRCDPCPVAIPTSVVTDGGCFVLFNEALLLFEYEPANCTADCPLDSLQRCNEAVGAPVCEAGGQCVHAR